MLDVVLHERHLQVHYKTRCFSGKEAYALQRDEWSMRLEISKNGPIEAALTVYEDLLSYKSGEVIDPSAYGQPRRERLVVGVVPFHVTGQVRYKNANPFIQVSTSM